MPLQILFWILMLVWLLGSLWINSPAAGQPYPFRVWAGNHFLIWITIFILGWKIFGPAVT